MRRLVRPLGWRLQRTAVGHADHAAVAAAAAAWWNTCEPDALSIATFSCLWCLEANAWLRMHSYLGCSPGARPLRGADVVSMAFRQRGCKQLAARSSRRDVLRVLYDTLGCLSGVQRAALLHQLENTLRSGSRK